MSTKNIKKQSSNKKEDKSTINKNSITEENNNEKKNTTDITNDDNISVGVVSNNQLNKLITSNVHNPFIDTSLVCPIMLLPNQMDNKMYLHLKSNLKNKLESKCYKNYGYVNKIYSIEEISDGIIEAEDPTCSAKITVRFTCSLCLPIVGKEIICKIDRMNKALISAINGPIKAIITTDKINKENFFPDMNRNVRIKGNSQVLIPEMYIRILILSKSFGDYDKNILVIGYLQDIATEEQIEQYYKINNDNSDINNILNDEY
jgi:DNA-directed RNA polymerase subunit E'/Rpb7